MVLNGSAFSASPAVLMGTLLVGENEAVPED
jgi:hypothetical protein